MILKRGLLTQTHLRMELDRRASPAAGVSASSLGGGEGAEGGAAAGAEESGDDGVVKKGGKKKKGKATGSGGDEAGSGAGGAGEGDEKKAEGGGGKALAAREAAAQEDVAEQEQRSISDMAAATCQQIHELGKRVVRLQQQNLKLLEQVGHVEDLRLTADTLRRDKYLAEEELSRYASKKRPAKSPVMLKRDLLTLTCEQNPSVDGFSEPGPGDVEENQGTSGHRALNGGEGARECEGRYACQKSPRKSPIILKRDKMT